MPMNVRPANTARVSLDLFCCRRHYAIKRTCPDEGRYMTRFGQNIYTLVMLEGLHCFTKHVAIAFLRTLHIVF